MTKIHYFQRYSQPENVVTNNTLLLLSRLYTYSSTKFKAFLNALVEGIVIDAGINFVQQSRKRNGGIPDGMLYQSSFRILIETKLNHKDFHTQQLIRHLENFEDEQLKMLMLLSPKPPAKEFLKA